MDTPYDTKIELSVHSTQDFARTEFSARADATPLLIVAERQTAGRGRRGHEWWNAPRAMLASIALPKPDIAHLSLVSLGAGLAASDAIASEFGVETALKWPNDLVLAGAKAGGILAEVAEGVLVVGCGVNLYWPDPPPEAVAILAADPGADGALALAHAWASRLLDRIAGLATSFDHTEYMSRCVTIGTMIRWDPEGSGRAVGIDGDGALIVEAADGIRTLHSEEVTHVRPATIPADQELDS